MQHFLISVSICSHFPALLRGYEIENLELSLVRLSFWLSATIYTQLLDRGCPDLLIFNHLKFGQVVIAPIPENLIQKDREWSQSALASAIILKVKEKNLVSHWLKNVTERCLSSIFQISEYVSPQEQTVVCWIDPAISMYIYIWGVIQLNIHLFEGEWWKFQNGTNISSFDQQQS